MTSALRYDHSTNSWTKCSPIKTPRYGVGVTSVDGYIYALGGLSHDLFTITFLTYLFATNLFKYLAFCHTLLCHTSLCQLSPTPLSPTPLSHTPDHFVIHPFVIHPILNVVYPLLSTDGRQIINVRLLNQNLIKTNSKFFTLSYVVATSKTHEALRHWGIEASYLMIYHRYFESFQLWTDF